MSSNRRRSRELTEEEHELWANVTRDIRVRHSRREGIETSPHAIGRATVGGTSLWDEAPQRQVEADRKSVPAGRTPPLHALDRRQTRQIAIGKTGIDARLDLHGMRQAEAHSALKTFLLSAQARGCRTVLIITGKGGRSKPSPEHDFARDETGVLRRAVPRWLGEPEFARLVYACGPSDARHGGDGALYVLLRRRRVE